MNSLDRVMTYAALLVLPPMGLRTGLWWSERLRERSRDHDCDLGAAYTFLGGILGFAGWVALVVLVELAAAFASGRRP